MSLALYRKYRPGKLDEVIGQDHVIEPLKRALANDKVHHAYLFSGPRGCGKTSSARILARSLNCEKGPTPDPCGKCASCVDLAPNGPGSIDVIEMDAATHGLVDDARDLREKAVYSPASSRYKIYIIDEAHQLGPGAANALLKLVEEPPPHLRFIFATTEPEKIIGTIRSRTHHYAFRLVRAKTLQTHLATVCKDEKVKADPAALALIARASGGSVRDSLSILGQLIAGADKDGLTYADASRQLGVTDNALIDQVVAALAARNGAELFTIIDQVIDAGHDPRRFVTDLLERLRDLLVVAQIPNAAKMGLIDGPPELAAELAEQAGKFGPAELTRAAATVSEGLSELKGATAPRLQLELLMARLVLPTADDGADALATRVEQLERDLENAAASPVVATAVPAAAPPARQKPEVTKAEVTKTAKSKTATLEPEAVLPAEPDSTEPSSTTKSSGSAKSGAVTVEHAQAMWPAFLDELKKQSRVAWTMVFLAQPQTIDGQSIVASHPDKGTVARYAKSSSTTNIDEILSATLQSQVTLVLSHDVTAAPPKKSVPKETKPAAEKASPAKAARKRLADSEPESTKKGQGDEIDVTDSSDLDDVSGIELVERELGATKITEFDGV